MFSNKENINILTALLVEHGVTRVVVCPGSRNAAIAHNLSRVRQITCYAVTDERSAGFYALGMAQHRYEPVAVCVTSGTALLNLAPAVAEARYQQIPLVVISADRSPAWINQQDGQTLEQPNALGQWVSKAVSLPEPLDAEQRWHCNRLVNEALTACKRYGGRPVHINVPVSEPLFCFDVDRLPQERSIRVIEAVEDTVACKVFEEKLWAARRPLVVVGQLHADEAYQVRLSVEEICKDVPVLYECTSLSPDYTTGDAASGKTTGPLNINEVLSRIERATTDVSPDYILYIGGTLISKRLKQYLRQIHRAETWAVNRGGHIYDTFMTLSGVVDGRPAYVLQHICKTLREKKEQRTLTFDSDYQQCWSAAIDEGRASTKNAATGYSQLSVVKAFFEQLPTDRPYYLHAGNSMSIRLANLFARSYVWCNRGVNGIDGSLSTAAGFSLVAGYDVFCIIGDLSFFYDQNALWPALNGNLKVLLLNNHSGGIFNTLEGLEDSETCRQLVKAQHQLSAECACRQYGLTYLSAHNANELKAGLMAFLDRSNQQPVVFEVFTDSDADTAAWQNYHRQT